MAEKAKKTKDIFQMELDFQSLCVHILVGKLILLLPVLHSLALWKTEKEISFLTL